MSTVLLMSGGIDSASIAWWKKPDLATTLCYGQRCAEGEITASRHICELLHIPHEVIPVDCASLGSGDLAGRPPAALAPATEWWPFRNQLLITLAGMLAIRGGHRDLIIGAVRSDSIHKDGTVAFVEAMNSVLSLQEGGLRLSAPAIHMSSVELVRTSGIPRDILAWTHSCHKYDVACGRCRGCNKHREVMEELENELHRS